MFVDYPSTRGNLRVSRREARTCVKRPNGARTSIQPKYIFYTKEVSFTIVFFLLQFIQNWVFCPEFYKKIEKYKIRPSWPFLRLYNSGCFPSPNGSSIPEKWVPRRGKQSLVVEFPYLGYSPPKCNAWHTNIQHMLIYHSCIY